MDEQISDQKQQSQNGQQSDAIQSNATRLVSVEELQKQIEMLNVKTEEMTNNWKRAAADLANYKKQIEEEKKSWALFSLIGSVSQFLPILDNVNSALMAQPSLDSVDGPFKQFLIGLGYIQKQFNDVLSQMGVVEVSGVGAPFDPSVHESVSTDGEVTGKGSLVVSSLMTKGYQFQGQLIRPARVVVKEIQNQESGVKNHE